MKRNKITVIALLALGGVMAFSSITTAADESKTAAPAAEKKTEAKPAPTEAEVARLEADIGWSAEAKAKVEGLMSDQNARRKAMHQDASLSEADKTAKNKAIVDETRGKIKEVLTAEQYAKWQKYHEARKAFKAGKPLEKK